ncbi:asparagine synthase (glutamine-hydrolyzing) [Pseudorhizobium endolithicum]|uniref:asparagine synthase (glutamine-hydrolyzing) n=1 Tax=Pseudorhizobium endolithicum TaxID=1191678 RepID=A0ABM8PNC4_9HYPH|nr:asparagine synthase (glutamine-hydrolyzing) [Pseudorhizobium endolithicum]CAD7039290.1 asparagine synthase (glutamine-hydrolyzing) [Pseudorhizobium endolithicum]
MCGFAGFLGEADHPSGTERLLGAMAEAIAHRGPDGRGTFAAAAIGLAHVRLSIVGLNDGRQPMANAEGDIVIAFNGEIFNYVELRNELKARGCRFRTETDTEVLLQLYETFGDECLQRLNGDFAFAIWDGRRHRLLLARDRMGVRPLFYTRSHGTLYFASEIKALLEVPGVEAELDVLALDQIFTLWAPIAPRTAFRNILELEPGSLLTVEDGVLTQKPYWSLQFPDIGDAADRGEVAREEELAALLMDAVRLRMRADVPVGAYLSGGLDSSLITALAAPMAPQGLNTFSVAFDSREHDESPFQQMVAENLGTRHRSVRCGAGDIAADFPEVVRFAERPVLRTAPAPLHRLSGLVRSAGMKVVLTGEGADEVFAGYDIFREARVRRFCARQPQSRLRPHLFRRLYPYLPGLKQQSPDYLAAFFGAGSDHPEDPLFSHRPRFRSTAAAKIFYSDDLRLMLKGYDAAEELASRLPADFRRWHPLHQAQYLEARFLLPGYILSSQGDRMAMAHGVEGRFPFLDHRLVEFSSRLSPEMKLRGLEEKHILRKVAKGVVPDGILRRSKQPYRAPDSSAFVAPGGHAYVTDCLGEGEIAAAGLFNPKAVTRLHQKCRTSPASGFRDNAAFVGILSTQLWHKQFVRKSPPTLTAMPAATIAAAE